MPEPSGLTDSLSAVTSRVVVLLEAAGHLGLTDVYYGDSARIPRTPCAAVESGSLQAVLEGAPFRARNEFVVYVLLYLSKLQDEHTSRKEVDLLAEAVRDVLHTDRTMNGILIHSHVTAIEPGYAVRGGTLMRTARITLSGMSKTQIA